MKKVNLIGKKIMSAGIAASLLLSSLGHTTCFAGEEDEKPTSSQSSSNSSNSNTKSKELKLTANIQINDDTQDNQKEQPSSNNKKSIFKTTFEISKWTLISAFLIYAGYKNGSDILNFGKEFYSFILEHKGIFKDVVKGIVGTTKLTASFIWETIKFIYEHPEATKNALSTVGTYSIYNTLKNKIKNWRNVNKKAKSTIKI